MKSITWAEFVLIEMSITLLILGLVLIFWRDQPAQAQLYYEAANPLLLQVQMKGCNDDSVQELLGLAQPLVLKALALKPDAAAFWTRRALISFCARGVFDSQGHQALDIARSLDPSLRHIEARDLLKTLARPEDRLRKR